MSPWSHPETWLFFFRSIGWYSKTKLNYEGSMTTMLWSSEGEQKPSVCITIIKYFWSTGLFLSFVKVHVVLPIQSRFSESCSKCSRHIYIYASVNEVYWMMAVRRIPWDNWLSSHPDTHSSIVFVTCLPQTVKEIDRSLASSLMLSSSKLM